MQRHLAAFETLDAHARARGLALAAAAGGLALAGTDATADAHALLARAGVVGDIAELHRPVSCFISLLLVDDANEMLNLGNHAANRRGVLQLGNPADIVEREADQRRRVRERGAG